MLNYVNTAYMVNISKNKDNLEKAKALPAFYPFFSAERNLEYYRIQRGIDDPSIVETVLKETVHGKNSKNCQKSIWMGHEADCSISYATIRE